MYHLIPLKFAYGSAAAEHPRKARAGDARALSWTLFAQAQREAYAAQKLEGSWGRAAIIYYKGRQKKGGGDKRKGTGRVAILEKL